MDHGNLNESHRHSRASSSRSRRTASTRDRLGGRVAARKFARLAMSSSSQAQNSDENVAAVPVSVSVERVLANEDLLKSVFGFLDVQDLCTVGTVCSTWRGVSESDDFWTNISFHKRVVSRMQVLAICDRHRNIRKLNLAGVETGFADENFFMRILPNLSQLQTLELSKEMVSDGALQLISQHLPVLQHLALQDVTVGRFGPSPGEAVLAHNSVQTLRLVACRTGRLVIRCNQLRRLSLAQSQITMLVPTCPMLATLDMSGCSKISDLSIRTAVTRLSSLTSLNLSANLPLSDDSLREFASHLTDMTELNISSCMGITLNNVRDFRTLRILHMCSCDSIAPTTVAPALESCLMLEEVYMDNCGLLTNLTLALPRLRVISLRGCRTMAEIDLRCRALESLLMGPAGIGSPTCSALKHARVYSEVMTSLSWPQFPSLETVELNCPNLTELVFSDCDMLQDRVFEALSDKTLISTAAGGGSSSYSLTTRVGGCPSLSILSLDSCYGLKSVHLRHEQLRHLSLGGCKQLIGVVLSCPSLTDLNLEECAELERVALSPVGVSSLTLRASAAKLVDLSIAAPHLESLDLKGCGNLEKVDLDCPQLLELDACFCSSLHDSALVSMVAGATSLQKLVLSVCHHLGRRGLSALSALARLTYLDLSYTYITDLSAVLEACPMLQSLNVASCTNLSEKALEPLLPPQGTSLQCLRELDVSYCHLPAHIVASLLLDGTRFESLALNGCKSVTSALWAPLNALPPVTSSGALLSAAPCPQAEYSSLHRLTSLSMVKCDHLKSLCLGLVPASGTVEVVNHRHYLSAGGASDLVQPPGDWVRASCLISELRSLRLAVSGVQVLALCLPKLTSLDLLNCEHLRALELQCPLLLSLNMQSCRSLSRPLLEAAVDNTTCLEKLDVQHTLVDEDSCARWREACPSLRSKTNLLACPYPCHYCPGTRPPPSEAAHTVQPYSCTAPAAAAGDGEAAGTEAQASGCGLPPSWVASTSTSLASP